MGFIVKVRSLYVVIRTLNIARRALIDRNILLFKCREVFNKIFCTVVDLFVICLEF